MRCLQTHALGSRLCRRGKARVPKPYNRSTPSRMPKPLSRCSSQSGEAKRKRAREACSRWSESLQVLLARHQHPGFKLAGHLEAHLGIHTSVDDLQLCGDRACPLVSKSCGNTTPPEISNCLKLVLRCPLLKVTSVPHVVMICTQNLLKLAPKHLALVDPKAQPKASCPRRVISASTVRHECGPRHADTDTRTSGGGDCASAQVIVVLGRSSEGI